MGDEYRITTAAAAGEAFIALCTRLGGRQVSAQPVTFEFRSVGSPVSTGMPDATVTLPSGEVWFCDSGGSREFVAVLFRRLIDAALTQSDWPEGIRLAQP